MKSKNMKKFEYHIGIAEGMVECHALWRSCKVSRMSRESIEWNLCEARQYLELLKLEKIRSKRATLAFASWPFETNEKEE